MKDKRFIIGAGNPDRGDDAIGRIVAAQLRDRIDDDRFEVMEHDGEVTGLLEYLEQAHTVIIIDAAASGAEPGTIHRFDAHEGPLPRAMFTLSTHGFGPAEAIELARAMGVLPTVCVVYAVEAATFDAGRPLSNSVMTAVHAVSKKIAAELT